MDNNIKFWNKVAKLYTPIQEKANKASYQEVITRTTKYLKKDFKVLELACGSGQLSFALANLVDTYEATDFSINMVNEAKKRNKTKAHFSVQDATNLPYQDQSFDCIIIANALHIMPNPTLALKEISRVIKDDGYLIAPTFVYDDSLNKLRMFILEKVGFKTFNKWKMNDYINFIKINHFDIIEQELLKGKPLSEAYIVSKKVK